MDKNLFGASDVIKLFLQGGGAGVSFFASVILANTFSTEDYALYNVLISYLLLFCSFSSLGYGYYSLKLIPQAKDDISNLLLVKVTTINLVTVLIPATAILAEFGGDFGLSAFGVFLFYSLILNGKFILQASGKTYFSLLIQNWLLPTSVLLLCAAAHFFSFKAEVGALLNVVALLSFLALVSVYYQYLFKRHTLIGKNLLEQIRNVGDNRTAFTLMLSNGVQISFKFLDVIVLSLMGIPLSLVAIYVAALKLNLICTFLLDFVLHVFSSRFSSLIGMGDKERLWLLFKKIRMILIVYSVSAFFIFVLFGQSILGLFGDEYTSAYTVLLVLSVGGIVNSFSGPSGMLLNLSGFHSISLRYTVYSLLACTLMLPLFVLYFDIIGSALAIAICVSFRNIVLFLKAKNLILA